ncbi:hypothetical protein [Deinococcus arcticus]|uniref:DinB-like domain-containing protein n=1 Tax=Deinococcus arcticus TaxID=2136176 RepID=A0A2T3WAL7_9DEIO|nr:hypothetical protein [Deinococcus arcticus]PTA68951.1 hypothetical protein C8263_03875 [Deinococcus arcticus]
MTPDLLATLLDAANHAPTHSVRAALVRVDGQPHPRVAALSAHLRAVKYDGWARVAAVGGPVPPEDAGLTRLMAWEVAAARALPPELLLRALVPAGPTVQDALMALARHTVWHAGQIAALARRPLVV